MRGSVVLFGSTQQNRQEKATQIISKDLDQKLTWKYLENFPDIKIVEPLEEKKSIGIAQAKEAVNFLQEKPLALNIKIVVLSKAHLLTDEAQNCLLKSLEEPPEYALIILLSKTEGALLPTVLSRCRKFKTFIDTTTDKGTSIKKELTLKYVIGLTAGQRIDWAEETAKEDKDTIIDILESWIDEGRFLLRDTQATTVAKNLEIIVTTLEDLENTSVGGRLALEQLVLNLT
jgi:hypothetical protein